MTHSLPATALRVAQNTDQAMNQRIQEAMERNVAYFANHPDEIDRRLDELDREWDIERTLETNASALAIIGVVLGVAVDRRWLALPALVTAFLFQHATQGWCPPLPLLRRLGVRTAEEIDRERTALRLLRGDFGGMATRTNGSMPDRARRILEALRAPPSGRRH